LNTSYYIAKKIAKPKKRSFSSFIIAIATIAVALSVSVMIISTSMVNGFTTEIANKVFGFWGHIHINSFGGSGNPLDQNAILLEEKVINAIRDIEGVVSVEPIANKPAVILKRNGDLEKTFLKGVGAEYNWTAFQKYLVEGKLPGTADSSVSRDLMISQSTANRMELAVGEQVDLYFISDQSTRPIGRRFEVCGIYSSGLEEFDRLHCIGDIRIIQRLNRWENGEAGSYEVNIKNVRQIDAYDSLIYYQHLPSQVYSESVKSIRTNIFDWLTLQSYTGNLILFFMLVPIILNMSIALLILILDRTKMIGTFKALGAQNGLLMRVFLYISSFILLRGLILGNIIGLGICLLQLKFGIITLPEESYYVSVAPIKINWLIIGGINIGAMLICLLIMIFPTFLITRISPLKALRFN
jgi:lipoprotein-releasing system permease protein